MVQFSKDFDLMRKKFIEMHDQMQTYEKSISQLDGEVKKLGNENLKLNTDIKVIRNEHSEVIHTVHNLKKKN